jgi:hypothetical protein
MSKHFGKIRCSQWTIACSRWTTACIALMIFTINAQCQTVKVPKQLDATVNRIITLNVEYEGDDIKWTYNEQSIAVFREYDPDAKKIVLKILPYVNNQTVQIKFIACKDKKLSDFATTDVVIGASPGPNPGPTPDPIENPLVKAFQIAYSKETDTTKAELLKALTAVYEQTVEVIDKPEITTWGTLKRTVTAYQVKVNTSGKLQNIQVVTRDFVKDKFSDDEDKVMTVDDKKLAKDSFTKLAAALKQVK